MNPLFFMYLPGLLARFTLLATPALFPPVELVCITSAGALALSSRPLPAVSGVVPRSASPPDGRACSAGGRRNSLQIMEWFCKERGVTIENSRKLEKTPLKIPLNNKKKKRNLVSVLCLSSLKNWKTY